MTMAIPETAAMAQHAIDNLESRRAKKWEDIADVPREVFNDRGEKRLNVEWVRLWVQLQKEDEKVELKTEDAWLKAHLHLKNENV